MKITYQDLIRDSHLLANKIKKYSKYKHVFGIPSGGIVVGMIISKRLNASMMSVEDILNYKENKKDVLVVDDLIDSGRTLEKYKEYDSAVLYKKPHSPTPTYYLKDISLEWVSFPHEKDKTGIEDHIIRIIEYFGFIPDKKNLDQLKNLLNITYARSKKI